MTSKLASLGVVAILSGSTHSFALSATPPAGPPGGAGASMIAARICSQIQRDVGAAKLNRAFGGLAGCQRAMRRKAQAAIRACMGKSAPGSDAWRRCIQSQINAAAKSFEARP